MLERKLSIDREQPPKDITLTEAVESSIRFVRRQWRVIFFSAVVLTTLGTLYAILTPARYTARAIIEADLAPQEINPPERQPISAIPTDPTEVDSQVEVLKSTNVLLPVVEQFKLKKDPEFVKLYTREWLQDVLGLPRGSRDEQHDLSVLLERLDNSFEVRRIGKTHIIEVLFTARSSSRAAELANAIANSFIQDRLKAKYEAAQKAIAWLENRLTELRVQASTAEENVERFKSTHNVLDVWGGSAAEPQLSEIKLKRAAARSEVAGIEAKLSQIQSVLRNGVSSADLNTSVIDTLKSAPLSDLRVRYLELAKQEAKFNSTVSQDQSASANVRNQIEQVRTSIRQELERVAAGYKHDLQTAKEKEEEIEKRWAQMEANARNEKETQIKIRELENTAKGFRAKYDDYANFLQHDVEQLQQQSMPTSGARIISLALPPLKPSYPRSSLAVGGGALAGLILGFAIALFREMADRVFRTRDQVQKILGTPCITVVPKLGAAPLQPAPRDQSSDGEQTKDAAPAANAGPTTSELPFSAFSEAIQTIRLAIDQVHARSTSRVIGVTSVLGGEGKTTIAANLARTIAQTSTVALVDCDLRTAKLTKVFAEQPSTGLREIVMGQGAAETAVKHQTPGFIFLPAGAGPCLTHPNEIFTSAGIPVLFEELRKCSDYIIVDLPPLGPVGDACAIGRVVDFYLLVIEWGKTQTRIVEDTLRGAEVVRDNLLGVVLNKGDLDRLAFYEGAYVKYDGYLGPHQGASAI